MPSSSAGDPTSNGRVGLLRGKAYLGKSQVQEAEADSSAAINLKADFAYAYWNRAQARKELGRDRESQLDRERAIELDPSLAFAGSEVGESLLNEFPKTRDTSVKLSPLELAPLDTDLKR